MAIGKARADTAQSLNIISAISACLLYFKLLARLTNFAFNSFERRTQITYYTHEIKYFRHIMRRYSMIRPLAFATARKRRARLFRDLPAGKEAAFCYCRRATGAGSVKWAAAEPMPWRRDRRASTADCLIDDDGCDIAGMMRLRSMRYMVVSLHISGDEGR